MARGKRFAGAGRGCLGSVLRAPGPLPKAGAGPCAAQAHRPAGGCVGETVEDLYRQWGYGRARVLGQGMEGVVHRLEGGLVGKCWWVRGEQELRALAAFYEELAGRQLPWDSPRIHAVHTRGGRVVSVEKQLEGTSLRPRVGPHQP